MTTASRPRLVRLGLRAQLMLLALVAMVPFIILVLANVRELARQEREAVRAHTASLAAAASERAGDHVRQVDAVLLVVSRVISPRAADATRNDSILRAIKRALPQHYNDLAVWAPNGANIGSSRDSSDRARSNVADRKYFRDATRSRTSAFGEPAISRSTGQWTVGIARPILDAQGGVGAVVSATTRLEALSALLTPASLPPGSVVTLLDEEGRVLARSRDAARWVGMDVSSSSLFAQARRRESGSIEAPGIDGVLRLTGFVHVRDLPWIVSVGVPLDAAMVPVRRTLQRSLALGALALLAALLLAAWLGGRTARPLATLAGDAAAFGAGQLSHRTAVSGDDEIGALGAAFNEMARVLEQRTAAVLTTQARARRLIDSNLIGILVSDAEGAVIEANDVFLGIVGYTRHDIEEGRVTRDSLTPPEHRPLDAWAQLQLDQTGHAPPWEQEFVRRDGRRVRVLVGIAPLPGTDHQHASFVLDLTERIATEEALRETHDTLHALIAAAPVAVFSTDASGRVQTWNPQAARLFGREAAEVLGRPFPIDAGDDGLLQSLDRALTGEPVADIEARTAASDGAIRDVSIAAAPLRDSQGAVRGAVAFVTDIAHRKVAARALEERDEQYRIVTDGIPLMIAYVDREQRYRFVNEAFARSAGRARDSLLGAHVRDVAGAEPYGQIAPQLRSALDGTATHFEMAVAHETGTRRLEVSFIPHRAGDGVVDGFFSIAADVTARHRLEEQQRHGETMEAMSQFAAGLAHDFEDALAAMKGAVATLRSSLAPGNGQAAALSGIERAAERGAALVKQLLSFSGRQTVQPVVIAINDVVRRAEPALRSTFGAGIACDASLAADAGDVYVDPAQIEQLLGTLAAFTAATMPNGGRVVLATSRQDVDGFAEPRHPGLEPGTYTVLTISDTEAGLNAEARALAFTPLFGSRGGLGLAGVYGLVRQLGGHVHIESAPGAGTTIEIWFPRVPAASEAVLPPAAAECVAEPKRGPRA
ncbi:MAG TPA: PAS domain S-box protein [Gemmatimonadaceae bacterium]|nr:PAS domain S-box protein [Gemmatimonadaceae bacterium]